MIVTIGKYEEALVYFQESLDANRSILGNTHPFTLKSINNMGCLLKAQGKRTVEIGYNCNLCLLSMYFVI